MNRRRIGLLAAVLLATGLAATHAGARPLAERPWIVAHGGASGYLPEDTMAAYALAIHMGADFIEPTVYLTADGVPVTRHQRALEATTNAAQLAAGSPVYRPYALDDSYPVDRMPYERVRELTALPLGGHEFAAAGNGYLVGGEDFRVPSFGQVLDYVHVLHRLTGRTVGVYPRLGALRGEGSERYNAALVGAVLGALADPRYGGLFDGSLGNVFLQASDAALARTLKALTRLPVVLPAECPADAAEAQALGAHGDAVALPRAALVADARCVERLHDAGLQVHVGLLADEPVEHALLHAGAVDAIVAAHPDIGKSVRDMYYPLVPDSGEAAPRWLFAAAGLAQLDFALAAEYGGPASSRAMPSLLQFALFQVAGCTTGEGEMLPYSGLQARFSVQPQGSRGTRWSVRWSMPPAGLGDCFRAVVTLRDGTVLERWMRPPEAR